MVPSRARALSAVCLVLAAACGTTGSQTGTPRAAASPSASVLPAALAWTVGSSFTASVDQRLTEQTASAPGAPAVLTQFAVTSRQALTVTSDQDGAAGVQVRITSWSWQHGNGSDPVGSQPAPAQLRLGPDGVIVSGTYWSMPVDPPLPGVDFFSAGLPPGGASPQDQWLASWRRSLADGTSFQCQVQGGLLSEEAGGMPVVQTSVQCPAVSRRTFADDGSPDLLQGNVKAVVRSSFDPVRRRLLGTTYNSTFADQESTPGGATTSSGTVTTTISFTY